MTSTLFDRHEHLADIGELDSDASHMAVSGPIVHLPWSGIPP